jgi:hypothetical protein
MPFCGKWNAIGGSVGLTTAMPPFNLHGDCDLRLIPRCGGEVRLSSSTVTVGHRLLSAGNRTGSETLSVDVFLHVGQQEVAQATQEICAYHKKGRESLRELPDRGKHGARAIDAQAERLSWNVTRLRKARQFAHADDGYFPLREHHLWKGELTLGEVVVGWDGGSGGAVPRRHLSSPQLQQANRHPRGSHLDRTGQLMRRSGREEDAGREADRIALPGGG